MSKQEHNALKKLYRDVYELDKENNFAMPQKKPDLADYCHQLRKIVGEAFNTAEINPIEGHKFNYHPELKSNKNSGSSNESGSGNNKQ